MFQILQLSFAEFLWVWLPGYLCRIFALDLNLEWDWLSWKPLRGECEFVTMAYPRLFWKVWTFQGQIIWYLLLNGMKQEVAGASHLPLKTMMILSCIKSFYDTFLFVVSEQVSLASFCRGLSVLISLSKTYPHFWKSTFYWNCFHNAICLPFPLKK